MFLLNLLHNIILSIYYLRIDQKYLFVTRILVEYCIHIIKYIKKNLFK